MTQRACTDAARRAGDDPGRIGGEELAVILPDTAAADALEVAARLREVITAEPTASAAGDIRVTVGIGEAALDAANADGRNGTACHGAAERTTSSVAASRPPAI
jgi:diguanylate cyclase (GGDEF)-like protein